MMQWKNMCIKMQWAKRLICVLLIGAMAFSFVACSVDKSNDISIYDLNKAMSSVANFGEMKYASSSDSNNSELFQNISDMDYSKIKSFFINYAVNGTGNADEIACIQVKNKGDINEAVESLNAHLKKRINLYSTYDKSQLDKLSKAVVVNKGNVVALIVADNSKEIEKAFYNYFEEAE